MKIPNRCFPLGICWAIINLVVIFSVFAASDKIVEAADTSIQYGGPFSLIDENNQPVTEADFRGEYLLVYFGYTFCPDICPTSLATMAAALKKLGAKADKIRPILVSVDPERDTPERLKIYTKAFHPRMSGLTGSREQIDQITESYLARYHINKADGEYLVDHTGHIYLVGPEGKFIAKFIHGISIDELTTGLDRLVE
jgi:protein SCO1/2